MVVVGGAREGSLQSTSKQSTEQSVQFLADRSEQAREVIAKSEEHWHGLLELWGRLNQAEVDNSEENQ